MAASGGRAAGLAPARRAKDRSWRRQWRLLISSTRVRTARRSGCWIGENNPRRFRDCRLGAARIRQWQGNEKLGEGIQVYRRMNIGDNPGGQIESASRVLGSRRAVSPSIAKCNLPRWPHENPCLRPCNPSDIEHPSSRYDHSKQPGGWHNSDVSGPLRCERYRKHLFKGSCVNGCLRQ